MKRKIIPLLVLLLTGLALAKSSEYLDITYPDLLTAVKAHQVVLIDCNGTDSYRDGHIPGAIDFDTQGDNLASHLPKDKSALVVAYCLNPG
ncbi:MAG TPA: rhodanese-like domain-containing protein [Candidatus Xenobia bacterium]|jgi:rhodanese-related sulfurtransferase